MRLQTPPGTWPAFILLMALFLVMVGSLFVSLELFLALISGNCEHCLLADALGFWNDQ